MTKLDGCNSLNSVQKNLVVLGVVDMYHLILSNYFLQIQFYGTMSLFVLLVAPYVVNFSQYRGYPKGPFFQKSDAFFSLPKKCAENCPEKDIFKLRLSI